MQRRTILILVGFFAFLSLTLISQEPTKKQLKEREKQQQHNVVFDTVIIVTRSPDTLMLEQMKLNMKLDSLYKEKAKKQ